MKGIPTAICMLLNFSYYQKKYMHAFLNGIYLEIKGQLITHEQRNKLKIKHESDKE